MDKRTRLKIRLRVLRIKNNLNKIISHKHFSKIFIWIVLFFTFMVLVYWYSKYWEVNEIKDHIREKNFTTDKYIEEYNFFLEEKNKWNNFFDSIDLFTDESLQRFVTSNVSFDYKAYVPENLENIRGDYIIDSKWWTQILREEANYALQKMSEQFYEDMWERMVVVSAYRSFAYQQWIKDRWCPDNLCAKAWFSEHQSWLAVDFWEASSEASWNNSSRLSNYYEWLDENAHNYWFHNTYQRWLSVDWYEIEPWHWRFLGVKFATYLKENDLTIAEFYKNTN